MKPLPTIDDVARLASVSTATVSRCLNLPEQVRPGTRERVLRAIEELGYTPHFGGRALASNQTGTMGAVIPTMDNAIFARGLQAVQEELAAAGSTLLVATSDYDPDREFEQIRALIARGIDGLILIGESRPQATYDFLRRRGVNFILVWCWLPDGEHVCVGFDNAEAARRLTERVIALGHRQIGMISGITAWNDRAAARLEGVRHALALVGLELTADRIEEVGYSLDEGTAAATRLLTRHPTTTAIICGNDVLAAGAMRAARAHHLTVPDKLSICGFDDIDLAQVMVPPLTTVHVPHRRMGSTAAQILLESVRTREPGKSVEFTTEIIERGTLAPPADSNCRRTESKKQG